jgi:hypothetical protein
MPATSTACAARSSPCDAASLDFRRASSFSSVRPARAPVRCARQFARRRLHGGGGFVQLAGNLLRPGQRVVAGDGLDAADAGGHAAFGHHLEQTDVASARTWVPPHSSRDEPMSSTRTESPYFSPNSAIAPPLTASSKLITCARVPALARISRLTISSTRRISSASSPSCG